MVSFPVDSAIIRVNRSVFSDKTVVKSTATALGMIKLPTLMGDADQLAEVRRQTDAFLAGLPLDDEGRKVIVEGGGSTAHYALDTSRAIEYNREEIIVNPDGSLTVSAVLHRPLRAARSWCFGMRGVYPEAFDETKGGGSCVPYQLAAMLQRTSPGMRAVDLDSHFDEIYRSCTERTSRTTLICSRSKTAQWSGGAGGTRA